MKFVGYTIGLEVNGHNAVCKQVKVAYYKTADGYRLQPESARNMQEMPGARTISADEFAARPTDPYNSVVEARWALWLCGYTIAAEDAGE